MRFPVSTLDSRYDVRHAKASGTGMVQQHFTGDLLHRSSERIRLCRSYATLGSTCPVRVTPRMIKVIRMFQDGMQARVQLDDGDFSARFNVCQGLR